MSARVLGIDDVNKAIVARPIIETNNFYDRGLERDIENLFVGVISEAKGFYEMRDRFAGQEIVLVGAVHPGVKVDFGTHLGKLPYDQIPELMNRAKNFVFLPRWPEPQGRVVVEAALSGCKLVVNENVGATSFPFDIANPENMRDSKRIFWEELEAAVE
jgi:glycosyltransferase involved in cell wall biosynthesis